MVLQKKFQNYRDINSEKSPQRLNATKVRNLIAKERDGAREERGSTMVINVWNLFFWFPDSLQ